MPEDEGRHTGIRAAEELDPVRHQPARDAEAAAILARAGYFDRDEIWRLREINSPVQGHPIQGMMPGVEATTGSLGQGLSVGVGHVLGGRMNELDYNVHVLLGDGECEAGQIWEAAMAAAHFDANNLIAILDYNKYQETGPISREMALEPLKQKWESFGWYVIEADGHDFDSLLGCLKEVEGNKGQPSIIISHSIKGKGVSYMEDVFKWHARVPTDEELAVALAELGEAAEGGAA